MNDLLVHGENELTYLQSYFQDIQSTKGVESAGAKSQYKFLKQQISSEFSNKSFTELWAIFLTKEPYKTIYVDILHFVQMLLVIPVSSAECDRIGFAVKWVKSRERSSLTVSTVCNLVRISTVGPALEAFDPKTAIHRWLSSGQRPRRGTYSMWPESEDSV